MRSASWFSASRSGRPKFCWSNVFLNSGPDRGAAARRPPCQAPSGTHGRRASARDSRSSASGNCSSNTLMRAARRFSRNAYGPHARQDADCQRHVPLPDKDRCEKGHRQRHADRHADDAARRCANAGLLDEILKRGAVARACDDAIDRRQRTLSLLTHNRLVTARVRRRRRDQVRQPLVHPPPRQHARQVDHERVDAEDRARTEDEYQPGEQPSPYLRHAFEHVRRQVDARRAGAARSTSAARRSRGSGR